MPKIVTGKNSCLFTLQFLCRQVINSQTTKTMIVQVKLLKYSCLSSPASTNLKRLQPFCMAWSLETPWAGPAVSLDCAPTAGSTEGSGTQMPK